MERMWSSPPPYEQLLPLLHPTITLPELKQIHARALRTSTFAAGHNRATLLIHTRLLLLSSSLSLPYASRLLTALPTPPTSFFLNTLLRAHASSPDPSHKLAALRLYLRALSDGRPAPDKYTFPFLLKACAYLCALDAGRQLHSQVVKLGLALDIYVVNSLVHFYGSCGCMELARRVFDGMGARSAVSWNALVDGYVKCCEFETALGVFKMMQEAGSDVDGFTMLSVVGACAGLAALSLGVWAHVYVIRRCKEDVGGDVLMQNSLVDMYAKCGCVDMAWQVFSGMNRRNVASWNAMILGFAMHGRVKEALQTFSSLCGAEGNHDAIKPTAISFTGVLTACNHGGMVGEGKRYFDMMRADYGIEPEIEHYGCLVDLLARAGSVEEAMDVVSAMPIKPDAVIWRSLLDGCSRKNASHVEISELVAHRAFDLEGGTASSGAYVLLSRVYASANRWDDVGLVRRLMEEKGVKKEPGCSSMEVDGVIHEFLAGDTSHPRSKEIYKMMEEVEKRLAAAGYRPDLSQAPMIADVDDGKEHSLRLHSERLAIVFGLLCSSPGAPIRIMKNLRVCNDCHTVTKLISKVYGVEIIVRDRLRFHRFKDGACSCLDYW